MRALDTLSRGDLIGLAEQQQALLAELVAARERDRVELAALRTATERARVEIAELRAEREAASITTDEGARLGAERERAEIQTQVGPQVLLALALHELAGQLRNIDHLTITPELITPLLQRIGADG